jgi:hypothetical protein
VDGKLRRAPQVAWELENCQPFPEGLHACHCCDNPPCVNPSHVWPGTRSENMKDCHAKGRHSGVLGTHCRHGHEMTADNIKTWKGGRRGCLACYREANRQWWRKKHGKPSAPQAEAGQ